MNPVNLTSSLMSTMIRSLNGIQSGSPADPPGQMLQLYDIENCPYCRLVREALTELSLDAQVFPCPKRGERFRPDVEARGGKAQFPYLVDPNTGEEMYESLDIVEYLFATYGRRTLPIKWRAGRLQTLGSMMASAPRLRRGMKARPGELPAQMLELYSFESSPFARPVRELLGELEIPYILRNCGRTRLEEWILPPVRNLLRITPDSEVENRRRLQSEQGRVSIPFLFDPNTELGMFESAVILDYIEETYGPMQGE
jgi:glutathione S-transferase